MTNNEVLRLIDSVLFDLDTNAIENAKSTLKTLQSFLKCQSELNEFKRIVFDKMQFYNTRDKAKNKALYDFYQSLKKLSDKDFDFGTYYTKYIDIIK